jgi:hypothetical protein
MLLRDISLATGFETWPWAFVSAYPMPALVKYVAVGIGIVLVGAALIWAIMRRS